MAEIPLYAVLEVDLDPWLMRLDGTVFELFRRDVPDSSSRIHIRHLAVEAKPRDGGGLRLTIGQEIDGLVMGAKVDVPAQRQAEVMAFFDESRRRRATYGSP